jgi:hypothetical protein
VGARATWLVGTALAFGVALFIFAPAVLGSDTIFAGDISVFESPRDQLLAHAWQAGDGIPRWVPGIAGGVSARASQELGTLYPPNVVLAVLAPDRAEALGLVLHLALAALGALALARALGLAPGAALVAGLAFGFSGSLVSTHFTPVYVRSAAWLPWALAGLVRAGERDGRGLVLAALALTLGYLAGDPQGALAVAAAAVVLGLAARGPLAAGKVALAVGVAAVLAVLLAAIQLLPAALAFGASDRSAGLPFEAATRWSLTPLELVGLALPVAFGTHAVPGSHWFPALSPAHDRAWGESTYLGPIVLALVLAGLSRLRADGRARAGLALALLFGALALGANAPFYQLLFALPGGGLFRYPAKLLVPAILGLALLAATGVEALATRDRRTRYLVAGALGALALAGVVGTNLAVQDGFGLAERIDAASVRGIEGSRALAFVAPRCAHVALVALAGLALVSRGEKRPRALALALAVLVALDLAIPARSQIAFGPLAAFTHRPEAARVLAAVKDGGDPPRVLPTESGERPTDEESDVPEVARSFVAEVAGLAPNTGLASGVLSQGGFLSNYPDRLARLDERDTIPPRRRAILQGARFVLAAGRQVEDYTDGGPFLAKAVGARTLLRLTDAPPWASVHTRAVHVPGPAVALAAIAAPDFDPRAEVVLEGPDPGLATPPSAPTPARLEAMGLHEVSVLLEAHGEGWLVVREGYGEGWRASVDGAPEVPVVPADLVFRAVRVPAGAKRVVLRYVAPGERAGRALTLLGLLLLLGVAVPSFRRAH